MKKGLALIIVLSTVLASCGKSNESSASKNQFPDETVEIVAPASPGGGWDTTARAIQKIILEENLTKQNVNVINKPGGGGEVGWQYLKSRSPNTISINSSLLLSNNELGLSDLNTNDFTPIAILATEWISLTASNKSNLNSGKEVMEKLKKDPKSLTIGVAPGLGNNDHLAFVQAAKEYGVDVENIDFLVYKSGGDLQTALLGGHVDVASTAVSEVKEQHQTGKLKMLAVTSDKPIEGIEDVPTWEDQGIDVVFPHWRGVMGPKDMTPEQREYWDTTMEKVVKSKRWQEIRKNNDWENFYKDSEESEKFLKAQRKKYNELVNDSGLK
ncbi:MULTISPECIES: tripartite tricarboxylate transporter substrate binding protein [Staphylococcus]|uniref:Tripartite tricarboxylate transporter substrate binding protein n=2 Tax=Staphylococcus TaxID=1279 RepID=A0A418ILI4_STAXY|nr:MULTISPECIES: tripartite tricarboxylate transporter substrate binding protein [Staphylococcus]MBF0813733.1 tripartite tricarboxylate transporter substrate binding protein [Staphylococcus saprophyticus]MDW8543632.1 tripartite tricarboxylate transporter substrate binding protein [Staphylococcus sp. KG4-1]MRF37205.1 tripartite tricarboxylate transporter substrate binding protein [Staphylococcus sp. KY49P]MDW8563063.1 tripartite tricarboxylate transporter substrate binding protein [Staphylococcu